MKIIKEGIPSNQITCSKCECIFQYDEDDIQEETIKEESISRLSMDRYIDTVRCTFVKCPNCKEKYPIENELISSERKTFSQIIEREALI